MNIKFLIVRADVQIACRRWCDSLFDLDSFGNSFLEKLAFFDPI